MIAVAALCALAGCIIISMGGSSRADNDAAFGQMIASGAALIVMALGLAFLAGGLR